MIIEKLLDNGSKILSHSKNLLGEFFMGYYTYFSIKNTDELFAISEDTSETSENSDNSEIQVAIRTLIKQGISLPKDLILKLRESDSEPQSIIEAIYRNEDAVYHLGNDLGGGQLGTWYDHEDDLKEISAMFPDVLIKLYGEGEDAKDIWYKYFKGGKVQVCRAKIVFDEFDESKLQ